ncbi:MAG: hypothetical protein ABF384_04935 [Verrucomicrobiales bacterium]
MRVSILRGGYRRPNHRHSGRHFLFHHAATAQSWSLDPDKAIKADAVVGREMDSQELVGVGIGVLRHRAPRF